MVHIDINPIEVSCDYRTIQVRATSKSKKLIDRQQVQQVVYAYGVEIYRGEWDTDVWSTNDYFETEWRNKWEQFLGESFKKWVVEDGSREED